MDVLSSTVDVLNDSDLQQMRRLWLYVSLTGEVSKEDVSFSCEFCALDTQNEDGDFFLYFWCHVPDISSHTQ
jgi:hypothetical protein